MQVDYTDEIKKNLAKLAGKSSGYRLLYYLQTAERVVLVTIYSKSDRRDIRADKLRQLIKEHLTNQDTENHHPK